MIIGTNSIYIYMLIQNSYQQSSYINDWIVYLTMLLNSDAVVL